jgi:hypothetical protein
MRLPLLISGRPSSSHPNVRLPRGNYKIITENVKDSELHSDRIAMLDGGPYQLQWKKIGTETNLIVYAQSVD